MLLIDLNGQWKMNRAGDNLSLDALVPGSVYSDLMRAGKMSDPHYRTNEYVSLDMAKYDYEYHKSFMVEASMLSHERIYLKCDGLDTLCNIFLNETPLAQTQNMHRTYMFDIKNLLVEGENSLRIVFSSPVSYATAMQKDEPMPDLSGVLPGLFHLRKAHYMFGWDWGPQLPDMGIWRSISIISQDCAAIEDVRISQYHNNGTVRLDMDIELKKLCSCGIKTVIEVTSPDGEILDTKVLENCSELNHISLDINNPKLWWPNTFGEQPLYSVKVSALCCDKEYDSKSFKIGLRTLTVEQKEDEFGKSFAFNINGISIFSMGANYIPEDTFLREMNRDRTEKLIKDCVAANYNTIRVWGGAFYPDDYFYDLCDEYGLIVWQDLMFACGVYHFTDEFKENVRYEVIDNLKRIRHHACLGLCCGNNEQELAWFSWGWSDMFSPELKEDYVKQFDEFLPKLAKEIAPDTFYWNASPSSGKLFDKPNGSESGDMHYWGVWHGKRPFTDFRTIYPRYMSEFGIQSFPCLKTVESFTEPEDRNIFSYVMESHQKSGTGNEKILHYISSNYKYPGDFNALLYVSQLIQAEGLRFGVEHWRRNRGRCMGVVYWQLNDCWPVASWSSIDSFGRWKALHYAAKKFYAPVLISACDEDTFVSLHLSNETLEKVFGVCKLRLMDRDANVLTESEFEVLVPPQSSENVFEADFGSFLDTIEKKQNTYLEYSFVSDKHTSSGTVLFVKPKHFNLADPEVTLTVTEENESFFIDVTCKSFAKHIELSLEDSDAVFSDNFFDLSADTVKRIELPKKNISKPLTLDALKSQLRQYSLYNSY